ncbi:hypothetical protein PIB30_039586 [Stylosanthes scabra]|uniref:CCHC-type domain-containing protein n=1 Tax=Stylosanthes scabra TaxID=79078 RepID=A0ABU6XDI4_9FABA|nr:hypothetical protein [Stylosanthes scabra]
MFRMAISGLTSLCQRLEGEYRGDVPDDHLRKPSNIVKDPLVAKTKGAPWKYKKKFAGRKRCHCTSGNKVGHTKRKCPTDKEKNEQVSPKSNDCEDVKLSSPSETDDDNFVYTLNR